MGVISTFTFTSDTETVTRTKLNNLVANLKTEFNGSIDNSNIKASAGIIGSKLDLSTPGIIGGTTPAAGTFTTLNITSMGSNWTNAGRTVADMGILTTVDINGGTWQGTIDGNWTAAGQTVADLGSVTTCDINGGTLDGVQIGGTTATGELIVNNSSDEADGLGDQGDSGQVLTSAGAGANPTWENRGGYAFVQSEAVNTANDITITQTMAVGDTYKVIFQGGMENGSSGINLLINGATGANYDWVNTGGIFTSSYAAIGEGARAAGEIAIFNGAPVADSDSFYVEIEITAEQGHTQTSYQSSTAENGVRVQSLVGSGLYDGGTPTSIVFETPGAGTIEGRWYVYKLNQT